MRKSAPVKGHLPGTYACEARQVFRAFRDRPEARRLALIQSLRDSTPKPCDAHEFLNDQPQEATA